MADTKTFDDFFGETVLTELVKLDSKRERLIKIAAVITLAIIVCITAVFFLGVNVYVIISLFLVWAVSIYFVTRKYSSWFRKNIVERAIGFISNELIYSSNGFVPADVFNASKIFLQKPQRYRGSGLVHGTAEGMKIGFSIVHGEYMPGDSSGMWRTIFKGMFFVADFNKNTAGMTILLPSESGKTFGRLGSVAHSIKTGRGEVIDIAEKDFRDLFAAYGNNVQQAKKLLSGDLSGKLSKIRTKTGSDVYLSFVNSRLFMAIASNNGSSLSPSKEW